MTCFVDSSAKIEGELFNGAPIYHDVYENRGGADLRIIITTPQYRPVIEDLKLKAQKLDLNIHCLIPEYKTSLNTSEFNINLMLGYFRRKFLKGEVPTILSNDCTGGRLYQFLGFENISPTINTTINYENFVKLCSNPLHYFNQPLENLHYTRSFVGWPDVVYHDGDIAFDCDDIEILFVHYKDPKVAKETWDYYKTRINPNRFMYLLARRWGSLSLDTLEKFDSLNGNKLFLVLSLKLYEIYNFKNSAYTEWELMAHLDRAVENTFDLIAWFNSQN